MRTHTLKVQVVGRGRVAQLVNRLAASWSGERLLFDFRGLVGCSSLEGFGC
jgi:hypothetical protein